MPKVWVNGQPDMNVSPLDRGLAYGDGLFATMRVDQGEILFFTAHMERLTQGAYRLGFHWSVSAALKQQLITLAKAHPHSCIKLLLTRGVGGRGYSAPVNRPNLAAELTPGSMPELITDKQDNKTTAASSIPNQARSCAADALQVTEVVSVSEFPAHYKTWQQQGVGLSLSPVKLGKQPKLAGIKHCNRLEQVLIKSVDLPEGVHDWLVVDFEDNIIESSMANIFFVLDEKLVTPRMSYAGVAGMMREQMMHQLLQMGHKIEITDIHYSMLKQVKHAFITNSLFGLVDVMTIDDFTFTPATWTSSLREQLSLTL
ncbi:Aminodeoxychorismate lyase [Shewanella halifaxensis HAW-EB4]|uniref:Aminodeoxychorismate lyase n=1 Tax=Shewanella halifaxensis (strain HAW-EB4) TaxID=458817 RepID=B0TJ02_SHEHH|nr:aminodeoxychorismate lyase [Shewanella halifaxensis]ABZ76937.1 Aminodeoxychorismate lyase [Shewanella halifaxensis HAW-EB4]